MAGTVQYRLISSEELPYGPVSLHLTPTGEVRVNVSESEMDPLLAKAMSALSDGLMSTLGANHVPSRRKAPIWEVRIRRCPFLGGEQLIAADLTPEAVNIFVPRCLVSERAVQELSRHGTTILHHFAATTPVVGQRRLIA